MSEKVSADTPDEGDPAKESLMSETINEAYAARATGAIVLPEQACRCASIGYCTRPGDGDEGDNLCRYCMTRIDPVYSPCPTLGFGDD